ncbi:hypothetical protein Tco_1110361 [Tanacetum coccineum]|uniref:Uncharacterized protein n=1 Tax=Tanacetum coccineum TaxID=301880 RepID=A0ABQ5IIQ8_9ASTR
MSDECLRRRIVVNRRTKPPHPTSPSTKKLHKKVVLVQRRSSNNIIKRLKSEPTLLTSNSISIPSTSVGDDHRDMTPPGGESCVLFHSARVSNAVFSSSLSCLIRLKKMSSDKIDLSADIGYDFVIGGSFWVGSIPVKNENRSYITLLVRLSKLSRLIQKLFPDLAVSVL